VFGGGHLQNNSSRRPNHEKNENTGITSFKRTKERGVKNHIISGAKRKETEPPERKQDAIGRRPEGPVSPTMTTTGTGIVLVFIGTP